MKLIPLTQGQSAMVDDSDYNTLSKFKWHTFRHPQSRTLYACRCVDFGPIIDNHGRRRHKTIRMHRELLGLTDPSIDCDHRDCNGLNNQRYNLRQATATQNGGNTRKAFGKSSQFKGVSFDKSRGLWQAYIGSTQPAAKTKRIRFGRFKSEEAAARAYDSAAVMLFGEFARLNFPVN